MNKEINNNGYDYVDLGLPSGTKWATMNVGASKPSDFGLYFQWGSDSNFSKYNTAGDTLDLEDDAAHANMGGDWHMPTPTQIQELIDNTTNTWTTQDGVNGRLFISKNNGKSIFIPAAGGAWGASVRGSGDYGFVWSSMLDAVYVSSGQYLGFDSGSVYLSGGYRYGGLSVRGVIDKKPDNSKEKKKDMDKKLNIAEILKNVPSGTKLWSPIIGECELVEVDENWMYPIKCKALDNNFWKFYSDGRYANYEGTKCVLFPSEENKDWSTFKAPKKHKEFEPFQKVLRVDDNNLTNRVWSTDFYSHYDETICKHFLASGFIKNDDEIIPYEGNEDKLSKTVEK